MINKNISHKIIENGYVCVLTTNMKEKIVLRICAIHPNATKEDIQNTIHLFAGYAKEGKSEINHKSGGN